MDTYTGITWDYMNYGSMNIMFATCSMMLLGCVVWAIYIFRDDTFGIIMMSITLAVMLYMFYSGVEWDWLQLIPCINGGNVYDLCGIRE